MKKSARRDRGNKNNLTETNTGTSPPAATVGKTVAGRRLVSTMDDGELLSVFPERLGLPDDCLLEGAPLSEGIADVEINDGVWLAMGVRDGCCVGTLKIAVGGSALGCSDGTDNGLREGNADSPRAGKGCPLGSKEGTDEGIFPSVSPKLVGTVLGCQDGFLAILGPCEGICDGSFR